MNLLTRPAVDYAAASKSGAVTLAQTALVLVGAFWAFGGLFLWSMMSPSCDDDGTCWDMIDPVSPERAGERRLCAAIVFVVFLPMRGGVEGHCSSWASSTWFWRYRWRWERSSKSPAVRCPYTQRLPPCSGSAF
jgi:hypothetical protein